MYIQLQADGEVRLPEPLLERLGVSEGNLLECTLDNDAIRLSSAHNEQCASTIRINCFGRLTVELEGEYICLPGSKSREFLALLLSEKGRPMRKERVADILWPNSGRDRVLDSLYKVIRGIFKLYREGVRIPVMVRRNEVWIDTGKISVDVFAFEEFCKKGGVSDLESAVALYRAPFLSEEYFWWTDTQQSYYDMLFEEAAGRLIEHYETTRNAGKERYYRSLLEKNF